MITKCITFSNVDGAEKITIFLSGFIGQYIVFYETGTYNTEFEYKNKKELIELFPEYKEEINTL